MIIFLIYPLSIIIIFNGLASYYFGEIATEGASVALTCFVIIYMIMAGKVVLSYKLLLTLFPVAILISFGFVEILFSNQPYRFIFIYQYFLYFILVVFALSCHSPRMRSIVSLARFMAFLALISVLIAILQRINIFTMLPLENGIRSTGLSRTSLNFSGILLSLLLIFSIALKNGAEKYFYYALTLVGLVFAGGRGAMVCFFIYIILFHRNILLSSSGVKHLLFLSPLIFYVLVLFYDSEIVERLLSVFNFYSDQSNLDRFDSYSLYFNNFNFFGAGIGLTSPAAGRFGDFIGFESFILNTAYEVGLFGFIIISCSLLLLFCFLKSDVREIYVVYIISIFPVLAGQQLHASPSVFSFMVFILFLVLIQSKNSKNVSFHNI